MTYSRDANRPMFLNTDRNYKKVFFNDRGVEQVMQYSLPRFGYPSQAAVVSLDNVTAIWGSTDKLYNVAAEYYGDPSYWWVLAWYNQKATEADFIPGDVYLIPLPLDDVLRYF